MRLYLLTAICVLAGIGVLVPPCVADGQPSDSLDLLMGDPMHLMFVSYMGRSHMMPYLEILQPLADRGHKVTIVTDQHAVKWLAPNYPKFHIKRVPDAIWDGMHAKMPSIMASMVDPKAAHKGFARILEHLTLPYYQITSDALRVIFVEDRPDLILCDYMSDACADMADNLGIKFGVTLSGLPPGVSDAPYVNGWSSSVLASTTLNMTLWQRMYNKLVHPMTIMAAMHDNIQKLQKLKKEMGIVAPSGPPAQRFAHALKVINTFIGFEVARPIDPLVQLVGPIRSHANSSMPHDIQQWIDNLSSNSGSSSGSSHPNPKRVIYVAFGTHVDLPNHVLTALMTSLVTTLDQGLADGVIWAVSNIKRDKFPADLDRRVLLLPFAPQKALLASPDVCLFVSHGGAESAHEAMYEGKPLLVIPFFGDQPMNAAKMSEAGFAEYIPHHEVTTPRVQAALAKLLNPDPNPNAQTLNLQAPIVNYYTTAAERQQALVRTLTKYNTQAAADMLLFFAHYGWDHLIPSSNKMSWYKASDADIYAVLGVAVVVFLGALYLGLGFLVRSGQKNKAGTAAAAAATGSTDVKTLDKTVRDERSEILKPDADVLVNGREYNSTNQIRLARGLAPEQVAGCGDSGLIYRGGRSSGKAGEKSGSASTCTVFEISATT